MIKNFLLIFFLICSLQVFQKANAQFIFSEDFSSPTFPPSGWTRGNGMTSGIPPSPAPMPDFTHADASAYGDGNGSALAFFFDIPESDIDSLTTPAFTPSSINDSLYFDEAYRTYTNQVDELRIYVSINGGASFTLLQTLLGGTQVGTGMVTAQPGTDIYESPLNSEWATQKYALPIGVNKVRFEIFSAVGNNLFLDNVKVGKPLIVLPVNIISFNGTQSGSHVQLNWKVSTGIDNTGFEIEKLTGSAWQKIISTSSQDNTNSIASYNMNDLSPADGFNYYRVKQTDRDGRILYSDIVKIEFKSENHVWFGIYPNPFSTNTLIHYTVPQRLNVKILVYDVSGKVITTLVNEMKDKGVYNALWNAGSNVAGSYFYKIIIGDKSYSGRMIKVD